MSVRTKTFVELFGSQADKQPDAIAVHHLGEDVTYAEVATRAERMAGWLRSEGFVRGDRVALLIPNSVDYVVCWVAVLQAGGIVVALNPETTARELAATLTHSKPVAIVVGPKADRALAEVAPQLDGVRLLIHVHTESRESYPDNWHDESLSTVVAQPFTGQHCDVQPSDIAQIIYTSGTTGRPKGVTLSHRNISANCDAILQYLELTARDSIFVTLPFFYSYGNSLLFTHLAVGGRLILATDFVFWNRALDLMQEQRATGFSGVPSSYAMLLHKSDFAKRSFCDLRYLTCAGGGLAPAVVEQLRDVVPDVQLFLMYGQTEATARLSTLLPDEIGAKLGSIGRGIPGVTLSVLDENGKHVPPGEVGEITARGDNIMEGYWHDPQATGGVLCSEGLRTGDLARVDEDGYIYIVGRQSDIIKSGAYRINPQEIEEVLLTHTGVAEVAVIGQPDEFLGESLVGFVVPSPSAQQLDEDSLLEHARKQLPRYKQVRTIRIVESLPKTSSGKIKRNELRATFSGTTSTK